MAAMSNRFGELSKEHEELYFKIADMLDGKLLDLSVSVLVNILADLAIEYDEIDTVVEGLGLAIRGKLNLQDRAPKKGDA